MTAAEVEERIKMGARGLHRRDVDDPTVEAPHDDWDLLVLPVQLAYEQDARAVLEAARFIGTAGSENGV